MSLFIEKASEKLINEWNKEKNTDIDINTITVGSGKKVWWKCEKGHEWQAVIFSRTRGNGCPYCAGKRVKRGYNDLASKHPELVKEWNYKKNENLNPEEITSGSDKKVWWICKYGHEWQATVNHRTKGINCPYCSGRYAISGEND